MWAMRGVIDEFGGDEDVGETVADEVDKSDDVSTFVDSKCFFLENSPSCMDDEKKDENPIDVPEMGPYCILLINVSIDKHEL